MRWEAIKRYTEERVRDPQPGDHFTENLGSVALVRWRIGPFVFIQKPNHSTGHFGKPHGMLVSALVKWFSYGTIPGVWVTCYPPKTDSTTPKERAE